MKGKGGYVSLPDPPCLAVVGGHAVKLTALVPSIVRSGNRCWVVVRAEDEWGNPSAGYRGNITLAAESLVFPVDSYTFSAGDGGVHRFAISAGASPGVHRVRVRDPQLKLEAVSNPMLCATQSEKLDLFWGDPHGGQLELAEKINAFFSYARDISALDFAGYQRNDNALTGEDWDRQQQEESGCYVPGSFVPLPGFEWSGTAGQGGHHNVYFREFDRPIRGSSRSELDDKSDMATDLGHITDVYAAMRDSGVVITPHVGGGVADLAFHEPALEPAVEITSTHGSFEWFFREALGRGYRVGVVGGSDGYTGRPGAEFPGHLERRYAKGGLTAVWAEQLTLESLLAAFRQRHCYATTGARILLTLKAGDGVMGQELRRTAPQRLSVRVVGTAALETVELFRGLEKIYSHPLPVRHCSDSIRVLWNGASRKDTYSGVIWKGSLGIRGGRLISAKTIRFDSPRSRVFDVGDRSLSWSSVTCGFPSGIVLGMKSEGEIEFTVALNTTLITRPDFGDRVSPGPRRTSYAPAESLCTSFKLGDLRERSRLIDIGSLDRKVSISMAPDNSGPLETEFTFLDETPKPGVNPYWVKVVQTDMEMAWSSPIFVDYGEG